MNSRLKRQLFFPSVSGCIKACTQVHKSAADRGWVSALDRASLKLEQAGSLLVAPL